MDASASERFDFLVRRMTVTLDGYERGAVALTDLVAEVESVIDALFDVAHEAWVERLRTAWSGLEITYAVAVDEARQISIRRIGSSQGRHSENSARFSLLAPRPDRLVSGIPNSPVVIRGPAGVPRA